MDNKIKIQYSKKWKVEEKTVNTIFIMVQMYGRRYGKISRTLKGFNLKISPRQIKYFYSRALLHERLNIKEKGYPKNYSPLLRGEKLHWE